MSAKEHSDYEYETLDLNEMVTGGREGFLVYEITGPAAGNVQPRDMVFVDTTRKPEPGELVAYCSNGLTCVEVFAEKYGGLRLVKPGEAVAGSSRRDILGVVKASLSVF